MAEPNSGIADEYVLGKEVVLIAKCKNQPHKAQKSQMRISALGG